jgi:glucoamylase
MTIEFPARASARAVSGTPSKPKVSVDDSDFEVLAQHMYTLMMRNVSSDGFLLTDPTNGALSLPGCIIAAPSFPKNTPGVDQDYVFNWVRDGAITAMEIAAAAAPSPSIGGGQTLDDYVAFARLCQGNARPTLAHAVFTVDGQPRPWTEQTDGPALQTLAVLQAWDRLDDRTKSQARELIRINLDFLLQNYQATTVNLWEEHSGFSFFARSAQLRCFREIAGNTLGSGLTFAAPAENLRLSDSTGCGHGCSISHR